MPVFGQPTAAEARIAAIPASPMGPGMCKCSRAISQLRRAEGWEHCASCEEIEMSKDMAFVRALRQHTEETLAAKQAVSDAAIAE